MENIETKTNKKMGRPKISYPSNWSEVYSKWMKSEITSLQARDLLGLKRGTYYKLLDAYMKSQNVMQVI